MSTCLMENGEEHGLIKTVANSVQDNDFKYMDQKTKEKCKKQREEDKKMVKARYINHRGANERLTKPYCRWAGDPIHTYHLIPGKEYDLPKGFVDEVNNPLYKPMKRSGLVDKNNNVLMSDKPEDKIHELVPVSF